MAPLLFKSQNRSPVPRARLAAFTLVELLLAMTILLMLLVGLLQMTAGMGNVWTSSRGKISAFQNARSAFSTLNQTLTGATLNTYSDYVNVTGGVYTYRTSTNMPSFTPTQFRRASELHFIAGPAAAIVPGATETINPGHAVLFQAPLGATNQNNLTGINRTLNSVAFYIQYGTPDSGLCPKWLTQFIGVNTNRFRLVQFIEPAENLQVYTSTAKASYDLDWLNFCKTPPVASQPRVRVLAEDVVLLILRPRLSPKDEEAVATKTFGTTYNPTTQFGSILAPNFHYDSRAWQIGYPAALRVNAAPDPAKRDQLMCNQLPPIIDVAMVCVDSQSLARLDQSSATPPAILQVPAGLFTDASQMEADLTAYARQLSTARVRFHILRSSVEIQGAKWSNN